MQSFYSSHTIHRNDRNSKGGGVCLIINNAIPSGIIHQETLKDSHELIVIDINIDNNMIRVILVYRTPKSSETNSQIMLKCITDYTSSPYPSIILGDFNYPDISWPLQNSQQNKLSAISNTFITTVQNLSLIQKVLKPTRLNNYLDLIFTNDDQLISNTIILPPIGNSDHASISFSLDLSLTPPLSKTNHATTKKLTTI